MDLTLYVITDEKIGLGRCHVYLAEEALKGGATVIQLRDKKKNSKELFRIGLQIRKLTKKYNALYVVNDRLDIALATEADGVHLGLDDLPIIAVRRIIEKRFIIGASVSSVHEARKAQREGADYLSVQSIFPTTSKDDVNVVGLERLREIISISKIPVIAIGGINLDNAHMVIGAGASGVAIISAIMSKNDVKEATIILKKEIVKNLNS
jgi:thiamine-phosphate pyrophosphorylase